MEEHMDESEMIQQVRAGLMQMDPSNPIVNDPARLVEMLRQARQVVGGKPFIIFPFLHYENNMYNIPTLRPNMIEKGHEAGSAHSCVCVLARWSFRTIFLVL